MTRISHIATTALCIASRVQRSTFKPVNTTSPNTPSLSNGQCTPSTLYFLPGQRTNLKHKRRLRPDPRSCALDTTQSFFYPFPFLIHIPRGILVLILLSPLYKVSRLASLGGKAIEARFTLSLLRVTRTHAHTHYLPHQRSSDYNRLSAFPFNQSYLILLSNSRADPLYTRQYS